ncbi:fimbria/pilus periplasmic chaperone [Escherichia coli]|uniref:fimbria/pilus periplasmic chaperone n=1 Tax=Escherichia coli TaxID=562 RepID=UPI000DA4D2AA|nr:fimbria/pilus periplasmic chaperone [Escherichia coli]SQN97391.1 periplasmic pilus chaperone family protein [Escherichia coli]
MKLKHVGMIVVSVLAMSSAAVSAAEGDESVTTTVNGGVIHFKGEVVNAACAIDSESMNQTVELGQVRSSRLAKAGDLSSAVGDRESLFWVNVKAIPAMEKDQKNENTLQLAIISRIKMFYRPTNLAMAPEEAPAMLRFRRSGSKLTLINPTPYFITVTNMKAGNSNLPNTMVPPKGEVSVDITHAATGDISFQTINDYGALTPRIKATMQ